MNRRSIATMMALGLALAAGGAEAGTLKGGTWEPTGCGAEPTPPAINGSSAAALNESNKQANDFAAAAKKYSDCFVGEAQTDSHAISTANEDFVHRLNAEIEKLNADSKAAVDKLNKKKN